MVPKTQQISYPQIQASGNYNFSITILVIVICFQFVTDSNNTAKGKTLQSISGLVYLFQGPRETNLKAVCSDQAAAGNGSALIWSNQELKVYCE